MTRAPTAWLLVLPLLLLCVADSASLFLPDSEELRELLSRYEGEADPVGGGGHASGNRSRRAIRWSDREEILQLHNKLRGGVYPTASDMEFMVRTQRRLQERVQPHPPPPRSWGLGMEVLLWRLQLRWRCN